MNEWLDQDMLVQDYKKAAYKMAEALLLISEPSWSHLGEDTKNMLMKRLIAHYMKEDYVPKHQR